ncbi:CoA ester lyase [uncultured Arthrobacter sp.]|uniref:HpcH/HpaI aldolase/citrate lyase family protein n=1 Tax=uncultured Arthrobacter sp. TaxID=114050 RepID=UPI0025E8A166|nr:CoA ester lyase [uncultured Arthrobacter sp.]
MTLPRPGSPAGDVPRRLPPGPAVLFCPADRPDRYAKALAAADTVIIDLEDAVAAERKAVARDMLEAALGTLPPARTVVRINSPRTDEGAADIEMLRDSPLRYVLVPKAETPAELEAVAPLAAIALCETARGVEQAVTLASTPSCVGLFWGGEDLTADIGGRSSRDRNGVYLPHVQYTRARVLLAATVAGVSAWDAVYLDIPDTAGLAEECEQAVAMGFVAKVAIHPSHTGIIREVYRPGADQVDWATRLLAAVAAAESGVVTFQGRMVDGPLLTMAQNIIDASHAPAPAGEMSGERGAR